MPVPTTNFSSYPPAGFLAKPSKETAGRGTLGARMLGALEGRIPVSPQLKRLVAGLPDNPGSNSSLVDNVVCEVVRCVWVLGGSNVIQILEELERAAERKISFVPRDAEVPIDSESSLVVARGRVGMLATQVGFGAVLRTKIATAVSELTRNILMYAGRGTLYYKVLLFPRLGIEVSAKDQGPGIPNVEEIMAGKYRSKSGLGLGLFGVKAISDEFSIDSAPGSGTTVRVVFHSVGLGSAPPRF